MWASDFASLVSGFGRNSRVKNLLNTGTLAELFKDITPHD
jgi:hypothetical protein